MCSWVEDLLAFWFPEPVEVDMDGAPCVSIPDSEVIIPEMYLRPELIPIKEPDKSAVDEAERVIRANRVV